MKIKLSAIALFFVIGTGTANAQHVKVRIGFPAGISIGAVGPRPYSNAIWIGPEWQWRGGRYECVPGCWAKPHHYGAVWIPGQWKYSRRGYRWVPGHWR
jgi:hypothetical protein